MKRGLLLFTALFMVCSMNSYDLAAQSVNITGKLVNNDGQPIPQAQISLMIRGIETRSDASGNFVLINTGISDNTAKKNKLFFDGRMVYLDCKGDEVNISIFDLAGREVVNVISNQVLNGRYSLYPEAYLVKEYQSVLIVRASVGRESSAYVFVPEGSVRAERGLSEISTLGPGHKSSEAFFFSIDTILIQHDQYSEMKIPIDCQICSFGNILLSEKAPNAPTNLTGISESPTTIKLNWSDNSNNETGFRIEQAYFLDLVGWSDFSVRAELSSNATQYVDEGLIQGNSYKYRVLAFNNGGSSSYTQDVSITTQVSNPISISGPTSSTGSFDIVVTYSWPGILGSTSDRFELEESTSPSSGFTKVANSQWGDRPQSYTFSLTKPSGTYYYRARANKLSMYTEYTEVISVSVNTPVQKAYLKVVNNTHYALIDIRLDNQQMVGQGLGVLQGESYTFEYTSSGQVNFVLGVGFWNGNSRDVWFLNSGYTQVTTGTTSTITFNNPTIGQLLSNFSSYRDWTGEYWVNLNMYMAGFRFYSNGAWKLFDNGVEIGSGNVTLVSWPNNAYTIKFKLCPSCDEILLPHPFGQFYYKNGPASWPTINYTAQ